MNIIDYWCILYFKLALEKKKLFVFYPKYYKPCFTDDWSKKEKVTFWVIHYQKRETFLQLIYFGNFIKILCARLLEYVVKINKIYLKFYFCYICDLNLLYSALKLKLNLTFLELLLIILHLFSRQGVRKKN